MIHTPFLRQLKHNGLKCEREETLRRERKFGGKNSKTVCPIRPRTCYLLISVVNSRCFLLFKRWTKYLQYKLCGLMIS